MSESRRRIMAACHGYGFSKPSHPIHSLYLMWWSAADQWDADSAAARGCLGDLARAAWHDTTLVAMADAHGLWRIVGKHDYAGMYGLRNELSALECALEAADDTWQGRRVSASCELHPAEDPAGLDRLRADGAEAKLARVLGVMERMEATRAEDCARQGRFAEGGESRLRTALGLLRVAIRPATALLDGPSGDLDPPNSSVVSVGVRGYPSVPREIRIEVGRLLEGAKASQDGVLVRTDALESLSEAIGVDFEFDQNGALIPLPLHVDDNGLELTEEEAHRGGSNMPGIPPAPRG